MALNPKLQELIKSGRSKYSPRGNSKIVSLKEGKTRIRVLPALGDDGKFWQDHGAHWIKAEKNGKPLVVTGCHEKVYDKPCPVCNAVSKALESVTDTQSEEIIKEMRSGKRARLNVIVRDGVDKSDLTQIMEVPSTVIDGILGTWQTYAEEDVDALDPSSGIDFIIERRGKGFDTEYNVTVPPKSPTVTQAQLDGRVDLLKHLEADLFRGEEQKALNAIAQITGVSIGNITGPALTNGRATNLALTNQTAAGAEDFDTSVPFDVAENPNPTALQRAAKPVVIEAEADEGVAAPVLSGKKAAPVAAPVAAVTPKQAVKPAAVHEEVELDSEEMKNLMAELDGMSDAA